MRALSFALAVVIGLSLSLAAYAGEEEKPDNFMQLHKIEIAFHEAGSTRDLGLMLSLFADDAVMIAKGRTYTGKEQIKGYWQAHPAFQPQAEWVGYTPAFRIRYDVHGDQAHLYFECLWVDKAAGKIAAHTNSDLTLARINGQWLIKTMKADAVPEL
jgi:ketosteroid isomerase-like protein